MMRTLHHHGDEQIRALWRMAQGFAESQDDMAFIATALSSIPASWLWVVPNGGHLSLVAEGLSDQFVVSATAFLRGDWPST